MNDALSTDVLVDARVTGRGHTGIARYVRELCMRLPEVAPIRLAALLARNDPRLPGARDEVRVRAPFLHPSEQIELPLRVAAWRGLAHRRGVFWVPAYNAACLTAGPSVLTLHDANHLALPEDYSPAHTLYYRTVVRLAAHRAAAVITVSDFAKREIVERIGVDERKIRVISNGVSVPSAPSEDDLDRVRRRHSLPLRYAAYLGNFKPHKNLETLLRIAPTFAREVPLVLIGGHESELGNALPAARSLGAKVLVLRDVSDDELWPLLAGAAVFVFPSRYEGFGLPPLEAMALGVPVVTTTAGALPEVVGDSAILVDPNDETSLAQAIERVLGDPAVAAELSRKGRLRAARYSWDRAARQTARILVEAAQG